LMNQRLVGLFFLIVAFLGIVLTNWRGRAHDHGIVGDGSPGRLSLRVDDRAVRGADKRSLWQRHAFFFLFVVIPSSLSHENYLFFFSILFKFLQRRLL
jgi:hypothetical protein